MMRMKRKKLCFHGMVQGYNPFCLLDDAWSVTVALLCRKLHQVKTIVLSGSVCIEVRFGGKIDIDCQLSSLPLEIDR